MIEEILEPVSQISLNPEWTEFTTLVKTGFLKKLNFGEDRPYTRLDFSSDLNHRLDILNKLHLLLTEKQFDVQEKGKEIRELRIQAISA